MIPAKPPVRIGAPLPRVDGRAKVTGSAKYAGEFGRPGLAHGVIVSSGVARGKIAAIDAREALVMPGVLQVFTHENRPSLPWFDRSYGDQDAPPGSPFRPLYGDEIAFSGQPIALVVADTLEAARDAATRVRVRYAAAAHGTDLAAARGEAYEPKPRTGVGGPPKPRGDAGAALAKGERRIDAEYRTPTEHHNPLEAHTCTVLLDPDGALTLHDKTQGVFNTQGYVCKIFDLPKEKVRVLSPFVGGAFGSCLRPQPSLFLAVMAALTCKRDVRVEMTREQMFACGHRPETIQRVSLGADATGKLVAVKHASVAETSRFEDYSEAVVAPSGHLYQCDDVELTQQVVALDVNTPMDMRAPGAALGVYALESAMDELAHVVGVDPLALRLLNYAERDQNADRPFSSKELRACYARGAERFGWSRRAAAPRSTREGHLLVGYGMATGTWEAMQMPARCKARLGVDGKLVVECGTADIGTGTTTVMAQIAAATLGLPIADVTARLGDTDLPLAPLQGGSWTVSSVGTAVEAVCQKLAGRLLEMAKSVKHSRVAGASSGGVIFEGGRVCRADEPSQHVSYADAMRAAGVLFVEDVVTSLPDVKAQAKYTRATHSAVFAEVAVDEDLGVVRVRRVVSAIAGGRIVNEKTARSQILGGVVWGIGMALEEESLVDHALGRVMNHSLAEYHVPVHADAPHIDVLFVEEEDAVVNPIGAKGLGEIGIVGVAAAIANAVFHATGKRVRDLPITLDKLL